MYRQFFRIYLACVQRTRIHNFRSSRLSIKGPARLSPRIRFSTMIRSIVPHGRRQAFGIRSEPEVCVCPRGVLHEYYPTSKAVSVCIHVRTYEYSKCT